ncbi:ribonuclease E inhibitor RraB [Sphingomonas sp. RT2P30]|uniref:ribonuclease E inhibitor RraB n=1 Tax=Parasphingomonas halimpatiens TaxID=3096162 RepID=UPI002FCC3F79
MTSATDHSVAGDNDSWMLFERLGLSGCPLVVLRRIGNPLVDRAVSENFVTIVHCKADAALVNDVGMPQHSDSLYPFEEELAQELDVLGAGALHAASVTGEAERRIVIAHASPVAFEPILRRFTIPGYSLSASSSADRAALIDLITPTAIEHQLNSDMSVITNLERHGDDGHASRKTDFWFYGATSQLGELVTDLGPWGFSADHWLEDPESVVLTCETSVDLATFRELTPILVGMADRHGVTYDGWETFIVRADAPATQLPSQPKPQSMLSKLFGAKKN